MRVNLKKRGWSWGCVSAIDSRGRTIWIVDAHRDGKRFVVRADEKLRTFMELESAIRTRYRFASLPHQETGSICQLMRRVTSRSYLSADSVRVTARPFSEGFLKFWRTSLLRFRRTSGSPRTTSKIMKSTCISRFSLNRRKNSNSVSQVIVRFLGARPALSRL